MDNVLSRSKVKTEESRAGSIITTDIVAFHFVSLVNYTMAIRGTINT